MILGNEVVDLQLLRDRAILQLLDVILELLDLLLGLVVFGGEGGEDGLEGVLECGKAGEWGGGGVGHWVEAAEGVHAVAGRG